MVKPGDKHHAVKVHSFRRFFKTNLVAAGVAESRADYFLGHVSDTYNQVRDLGVEKLRESYARGQLSIRPQARQNLTKTPISLIQAAGKDPEQISHWRSIKRTAQSHRHIRDRRPEGRKDTLVRARRIHQRNKSSLADPEYPKIRHTYVVGPPGFTKYVWRTFSAQIREKLGRFFRFLLTRTTFPRNDFMIGRSHEEGITLLHSKCSKDLFWNCDS